MAISNVRVTPMLQVQENSGRSCHAEIAGSKAGPISRGLLTADRVRLFLKNQTFLGSLSEAALDTLLHRGHTKKYSAGDVVCRRQDRGDTLMLIIEGLIKITNSNADGKEIVLNFLGSGDTYGEIAVFDGHTRTADVIAVEDAEVFTVHGRDLLPLLCANPQTLLEIVQVLCEKLRAASATIEDNSLDMRRRLARGLLRLALQHGQTTKNGIRVNLMLSQSELAAYLGLSRENVNRQLGQLKEANVIRKEGAQIVVTDEIALSEIAEECPVTSSKRRGSAHTARRAASVKTPILG
jgi:CRP/FNR family cyclic AMP-dependent transcriptional regulator